MLSERKELYYILRDYTFAHLRDISLFLFISYPYLLQMEPAPRRDMVWNLRKRSPLFFYRSYPLYDATERKNSSCCISQRKVKDKHVLRQIFKFEKRSKRISSSSQWYLSNHGPICSPSQSSEKASLIPQKKEYVRKVILKTQFKLGSVPDRRSRDLEVVVVRRTINLGAGNLEWEGNGEGLRKRRSVYE
jgi:hypothetical protein